MDRRSLLRGGLAGAGAAALAACAPPPPAPFDPGDPGPFDCGVASGVHSDTASVLWTRFAPAALASVGLTWQVATDPGFVQVVGEGSVSPSPDSDGCAKVLAEGLAPGGTYWYRFLADGGVSSPVGRTKTLPAAGSSPASVRFAVGSCQKYDVGFYPAWRAVAQLDLDAVVHLGDYIYENPGSSTRPDPIRAVDLPTYRAKYRLYRSDPDLRAAHAAHPWAVVWDDHEFVNNFNRVTIEQQAERSAAAFRAWWEYQPVWPIDGNRIHRRARWGDLVELALLDTRQYRDVQLEGDDGEVEIGDTRRPPLSGVHDAGRTIMGTAQRDWLLDGLGAAQSDGVTWKLIGNQVMISPLRLLDFDEPLFRAIDPDLPRGAGLYLNFDDWDGYQAERLEVTEFLGAEGIANTAFLTGDTHLFFQAALRRDYDARPTQVVAQEFVCGSISSTGLDGRVDAEFASPLNNVARELLRNFSPPVRYSDLIRRGFGLVECTPSAATVDFYTVDALRVTSSARGRVRFLWPEGTQSLSTSSV